MSTVLEGVPVREPTRSSAVTTSLPSNTCVCVRVCVRARVYVYAIER